MTRQTDKLLWIALCVLLLMLLVTRDARSQTATPPPPPYQQYQIPVWVQEGPLFVQMTAHPVVSTYDLDVAVSAADSRASDQTLTAAQRASYATKMIQVYEGASERTRCVGGSSCRYTIPYSRLTSQNTLIQVSVTIGNATTTTYKLTYSGNLRRPNKSLSADATPSTPPPGVPPPTTQCAGGYLLDDVGGRLTAVAGDPIVAC